MKTKPPVNFCKKLVHRTVQPLTDATFVLYFICAILLCGGIGFWIEILKIIISLKPTTADGTQTIGTTNIDGIQTSLSVFYPALIGTSCLLLILESVDNSDKLMASFFVLVLFVTFGVAITINVFMFYDLFPIFTFCGTAVFSVIGLWVWCVANGENPLFKSTDLLAPVGGDLSQRAVKGDISGYTS